jgi:hypothetical protein
MALLAFFTFIRDTVDGKESPATAAAREREEAHTVYITGPPRVSS